MLAIIDRFLPKININGFCWEWTASRDKYGYGQFYSTKMVKAHRFSYELFMGEIPDGLQIDHLCRNRRCVNPDHLEAVTNKENLNRGITGYHGTVTQISKTHCNRGHLFNGNNLHILPNGDRRCRTCDAFNHRINRWIVKMEQLVQNAN